MKTLLFFVPVASLLVSSNLFAQGTVVFQNSTTSRVTVDGNPNAWAGTGYAVALYYAADGVTAEDAFVQLGGSAALTSGIFAGGNRTAPITPPGGFGMFQVRGWTTAYANSYEGGLLSPRTDGLNKIGKSNIIRVDAGDPTVVPPGTAVTLPASGLQGFSLCSWPDCVPEPSTIGLSLLGAGALFLLRRRR